MDLQALMPMLKPALPKIISQIEPKLVKALSSKQQKAKTQSELISQSGYFVVEKDGQAMAYDCHINEDGQMIKLKSDGEYNLRDTVLKLIK